MTTSSSTTMPGGTATFTPAATSTAAALANCPAAGTARAAVMPSLVLGSHSNLVYTFQSFSSYLYQGQSLLDVTSFLKRYDVTSGVKTVIATLPHSRIDPFSASISPDGQWIMFETYTDVHPLAGLEFITKLELVRIDGQYLQTLFCGSTLNATFPDNYAPATSWSPDQKLLLFNHLEHVQNRDVEKLDLLNLSSGSLQEMVSSESFDLSPSSWLDATRAFLLTNAGHLGTQGLLVLDTSQGPDQQETSLQTILKSGQTCQSFAISPDNTQLYVGHCIYTNNGNFNGPSTLSVQSVTGGTSRTIFNSQFALCDLELISSASLLLLLCNTTASQNSWWKINTDGTGLTRQQSVDAASTGLPVIAHDGNTYGFVTNGTPQGTQIVLIGTLNGGTPKTIATTTNSAGEVGVVGWATD